MDAHLITCSYFKLNYKNGWICWLISFFFHLSWRRILFSLFVFVSIFCVFVYLSCCLYISPSVLLFVCLSCSPSLSHCLCLCCLSFCLTPFVFFFLSQHQWYEYSWFLAYYRTMFSDLLLNLLLVGSADCIFRQVTYTMWTATHGEQQREEWPNESMLTRVSQSWHVGNKSKETRKTKKTNRKKKSKQPPPPPPYPSNRTEQNKTRTTETNKKVCI